MRLNQLVFWGLFLEQVVSQSKSANISESITEGPILRKDVAMNDGEDPEQCILEYRQFKNSYLRYVNRPNYKDYITSFEGCFHECCIANSFCKSFSYFPDTNQCFLMNVTRHDEGVVMAYSLIHWHVEMINPDYTATTEMEDSLLSFATTAREIAANDGDYGSYTPTTEPAGNEINVTFTAYKHVYGTNGTTTTSGHAVENPNTIKNNAPNIPVSKAVDNRYPNSSFVTIASVWKFAMNFTTPIDETQSGDGKRQLSDDITFDNSAGNDAKSGERIFNVTQTETNSKPIESSFVTHRTSIISKITTLKANLHMSTVVQQAIAASSTSSNRHQRTRSSSTATKHFSTPTAELHDSVTLPTTTFRYSPTLSRLTTSTSRPPDTKRTSPTTKQQEKTKSKSASNGNIVTRFVLKPDEKKNVQNNQQHGQTDKLTSCGLECKNGGRCKIYRNVKRILKCQCKDGFKGQFCEKVVVASKRGVFRITWWIILLIVVAIILFISVVATFFIFYIYKRKVGNYNLTKDRRFELASAYSPDRIDQALGPHYASLAWQNRPAQSLRSADDANKSWIFCYFDDGARCESIYRMRTSK